MEPPEVNEGRSLRHQLNELIETRRKSTKQYTY
jgi:hypothetical protein